MNERDQQLYREALASGSIEIHNIRVMVIGHQGVGKTSLAKRLLGEEVEKNETKSTEGIDVHHLQINHDTGEWSKTDPDPANMIKHKMLEVLRHKHDEGKTSKPQKCAEGHDNSSEENSIKPFETNLEIINLVREAKSFTPHASLSSPLTIMDFAGQFLYYTTHQTFISGRTIYLLVTDLSLPLGDPVEKDRSGLDTSGNKPCSAKDYVVYWLNSVHSHVFLPIELDPGQIQGDVILVGTHLDVLPKDLAGERKKQHFEKIRELLKDRPQRYHLADAEFAVTTVKPDPTIDALRKKIFELAQKQDHWGRTIPARWLALENALLELAKKGKKVIPYKEVEILNESLEVKLGSTEELDAFLKFEHELGHYIFFITENLRAHVMLDPQWLIEGLKIWITSDEFIKKHPKLTHQWYNFTKTGQLTEELIELLWSEHPELHAHQKHLLSVMEKLHIIAKDPINYKRPGKNKFYWVPCMVHRNGSEYAKTLGEGNDLIMTPALCFVSKTKFIHVGVFHRLLASCLTKWQPAKKGDEYLFFNGICEFELNKDHVLVLSLNDYVIQANVIRYSRRKDNPDFSLCITTREYLFTALTEIADLLCPACDIDICIKCSKSSPLSNEGIHSIKDLQDNYEIRCAEHKRGSHCIRSDDLLGFWEGKGASGLNDIDYRVQEHCTVKHTILGDMTSTLSLIESRLYNQRRCKFTFPTIVQTAESAYATNRFMKIYCLLVDLGTKVLRQLLNDKAAEQHLTPDQHLQQKKKDIEMLREKKVLLEIHMDIMFPTNGNTDLGKYDITLSSALLINIFPSLDDKEKEKVKVIREERNKFTHAKSTKMSNSEYQTKWTKVTTTLTDLSKLCQSYNFMAEIQRGIQQIKESESEDLKSVFEKYNEDVKKDVDAALDKYDESQKKDIEVRLGKHKEDLEKENENLKKEIENLKKEIENLKKDMKDMKSWFEQQFQDLR